jgi:hypothetical protein
MADGLLSKGKQTRHGPAKANIGRDKASKDSPEDWLLSRGGDDVEGQGLGARRTSKRLDNTVQAEKVRKSERAWQRFNR